MPVLFNSVAGTREFQSAKMDEPRAVHGVAGCDPGLRAVLLDQKGFRPKQITLVTTLVDAEVYPKQTLADLFRQRWEIETNFGHLKTTMKMDVLKCKTVDGALKELQVFALIYNLVRQVMLLARCFIWPG